MDERQDLPLTRLSGARGGVRQPPRPSRGRRCRETSGPERDKGLPPGKGEARLAVFLRARQKSGEQPQFESYRALGSLVMDRILDTSGASDLKGIVKGLYAAGARDGQQLWPSVEAAWLRTGAERP